MAITVFRKGCSDRFPSSTVRISFNAVTLSVKLIHMGRMNSIRITGPRFRPLRASTYATG